MTFISQRRYHDQHRSTTASSPSTLSCFFSHCVDFSQLLHYLGAAYAEPTLQDEPASAPGENK
jgi:hypothetical protein